MKNEIKVKELTKTSMELFTDAMLSEISPEEYARALEEKLLKKNENKERKQA